MKGFVRKLLTMTVTTTVAIGCSFSVLAEDGPVAPQQLDTLIKKEVVKVVETFKHDSYTGWLVNSGGEYHLYWATEDNYIIAGPLIDKNSVNLTDKYLTEKKPTPNHSKALDAFEKEGTFITTHPNGGADGTIYVFAEPFCGWCSRLHTQLEEHIANGLEVRWIPVSFLAAQSPGVIQYFLDAPEPYKAMQEHEHLRAMKSSTYNVKTPTATTQQMLQNNSSFMREMGIEGTPGIVYRMNGKVRTTGYMQPADLARFVSAIKAQ